MKTLSKLTYRYLKLNKKKSLITIISILLVTILIFSLGLGASTIRKNTVDTIIESKGPQHLEVYDVPFSNLDILNDNKNISNIALLQDVTTITTDIYELNIITMTDNLSDYFSNFRGTLPNNANEIIISERFAQEENLVIGSTYQTYKVIGIYANTSLNYETYDPPRYNAYTYKEFDSNKDTTFLITLRSTSNAYDKIEEIADSLNLTKHISYGRLYYDNASINDDLLNACGEFYMLYLEFGVYAIFSLILIAVSIFCALIVRNSFTISLTERKKQFGALRSIGASKKQIFKMVMLEASMVSLIAIPLGIILSFGFVASILTIFNKIVEGLTTPYQLYLYPEFIIIALIFIILTVYASAFYPALKASRVTPMEGIRNNNVYKIKKSKESYPLIKKIFGPVGEVAQKNMNRNRSVFRSSAISLSISIILFLTFSTIINYVLINYAVDINNDFDVEIYTDINNTEIINDISNIKGIDNIIKYQTTFISMKNTEFFTDEYISREIERVNLDTSTIYLVGLDDKSYNAYLKSINAPSNIFGVIVNNAYYKNPDTRGEARYDIFKDEDIYLEVTNHEDGATYQTIKNLFLTTEFDYIELMAIPLIVNLDTFYTLGGYDDSLNIGINVDDPVAFDEDMQELIGDNPNIEIYYTNWALFDYETERMVTAIAFIVYTILVFISLISITTVFSTINSSILTREKEFSVLRSIGMSKKDLNKMVILESIFLGLKVLIISIPTSMYIIWFLRESLKISTLLEKDKIVPYPFNFIISAIVVILLLIILVTMYSLHKIKKKNIVDSIKNENI